MSGRRKSEIDDDLIMIRELLEALVVWMSPGTESNQRAKFINWFSSCDRNTELEYAFKYSRKWNTIESQLNSLKPILIKCNNDVTLADKNGRTLLHFCLRHMKNGASVTKSRKREDKTLVLTLCKKGASIIANDLDGNSPLGIALRKKRMDLVRSLINFGCTTATDCNSCGETILHILVRRYSGHNDDYKKYKKIIGDLIYREEADINKPDNSGLTPVHLAARSLDMELLKMFTRSGAHMHSRTYIGDDLLIIVCKYITKEDKESKALSLIHWLLYRELNVNSKNKNSFTPLHYASKSNNFDVIKTLVDAGADLNAVANDGTNCLHSATMLSSFEIMQYFIELGVDFNRRDILHEFSLIHAAALSCDQRKCEWLLENRFDPNDLGKCELTPLHLAAMIGNVKIVETLIKHGGRVNHRDNMFKYTPLHLASMNGQCTNCIKKINGMKLNDQTIGDSSSLVSHCFKRLPFKADTAIDYKATIIALIKAGAEVNSRDNRGCTPLHYATRQSRSNFVRILLEAGAHVEVQNKEGFTPLHHSLIALSENDQGINHLLAFGANINDIECWWEDVFKKVERPVKKNELENAIARRVRKHLVKLYNAKLPLNKDHEYYYLFITDESTPLRNLYMKYSRKIYNEVKKLKERLLAPDVSLYDLLRMNFRRRVTFANSLPADLATEFPYYHPVIKNKCREVVNRVSLMEPAKAAYNSLTGFQWPDLCLEHIFSFLSNKYLRALIDSVTENECVSMKN